MAKATARAKRCSYKEGGRRCPRDGHGVPPLCSPHRIAMAELAKPRGARQVVVDAVTNLLSGKPINREATIGAAEELMAQWARMGAGYPAGVVGNWAHMSPDEIIREIRGLGGRRVPPPPAPPDPGILARQQARMVLGFAASERLTIEQVKDRKRVLAKRYHPDVGGSVSKMAAVNSAADVLTEAIEAGLV